MDRIKKRIKEDGSIEELHKIVVHSFSVGDAEDPDIYAAQPLWDWQESEKGKWVMEHSIQPPVWRRDLDFVTYGYRYAIVAELPGPRATEYYLKWGT
jgi:hypothetical protein